ncbi:hypothetical protein AGR1C_pAt40050 [Agrobacterium fabacearum TT111]|nr:hypothetical protein AGR1C_pAt40050 [Agrobacterium fabacearum TT111]
MIANTPFTFDQQLTILGVLMLTSKGSAGVAGAGVVTLAATLAWMHTSRLRSARRIIVASR